MTSKPRFLSTAASATPASVAKKSPVLAQRAQTTRGLRQPTRVNHLPTLPEAVVPPQQVRDISDVASNECLRRELLQSNGRSPRGRQREYLSAASEDGVLEEDDPDVVGQRRAQSID